MTQFYKDKYVWAGEMVHWQRGCCSIMRPGVWISALTSACSQIPIIPTIRHLTEGIRLLADANTQEHTHSHRHKVTHIKNLNKN